MSATKPALLAILALTGCAGPTWPGGRPMHPNPHYRMDPATYREALDRYEERMKEWRGTQQAFTHQNR